MHYCKEYCDDWAHVEPESSPVPTLTTASLKPTRRKRGKKKPKSSNENIVNPFLEAIERHLFPGSVDMSEPKKVLKQISILGLDSDRKMMSIDNIVEYKTLDRYSKKFREIQVLFPPNLDILKIQQVFNPFLQSSFQLKRQFIYFNVQPKQLFHGTKVKYVHSICTYNFDWRFNGAEKGHRYGQGVNFTPKPKFAINFCEKNVDIKVLILADVLIINKRVGNEHLQVPPEGCDTTIRENNTTYVKFCDAEFYPSYVIFCSSSKPKTV